MIRKSYFFILFWVTAACNQNDQNFYMPAEFEAQEAVWLGWEEYDAAYYPLVASMIKGVLPHVPVKIAVENDSLLQ